MRQIYYIAINMVYNVLQVSNTTVIKNMATLRENPSYQWNVSGGITRLPLSE